MRHLALVLPLFLPYAFLRINCWLKEENTPRHFVAILLALDLIIVALYLSRPRVRMQLILCLYSIIVTYVLVEIIYSYYSAVIQSRSFYAFEEPVNLAFDPVMGYKYTSRPARMASVISDEIQWSATSKGNNYGFPDADDFSPHRRKGGQRVVVVGDSFTGQPVCEELWPDYVEKLAARDGRRLELLSLAGGGYGVPNWTSLLENLVIRENWDIDEIVFAVYEGDDLQRTFMFGGQSGGSPILAHLGKWTIPSPTDDAMPAITGDGNQFKPGENALVLKQRRVRTIPAEREAGPVSPAGFTASIRPALPLRHAPAILRGDFRPHQVVFPRRSGVLARGRAQAGFDRGDEAHLQPSEGRGQPDRQTGQGDLHPIQARDHRGRWLFGL